MDTNGNQFHIVKIESENIKKLRFIRLLPDPSGVIIVGGEVEQGKTSFIDSIRFAFGGKTETCAEPIRRGMDTARVLVDCDDFTIERDWTADKGGGVVQRVVVKAKDGERIQTPETFLKSLWSKVAFEPGGFLRADPKKRRAILLDLIGVREQVEEIAANRATLFVKRTDVNRDLNTAKITRTALLQRHASRGHPGGGAQPGQDITPISVDDLIAEKNAAQKLIEARTAALAELDKMAAHGDQMAAQIDEAVNEIEHWKARLETLREETISAAAMIETKKSFIDNEMPKAPHMGDIDTKITDANAENERRTAARKYLEADVAVGRLEHTSAELTTGIKACDRQQGLLLSTAEMPVSDLSIDDDDIRVGDILFDQLSESQKFSVASAIGMAGNPQLRVLLIPEGAHIQGKALEDLRTMAADNGYQIFMASAAHGDQATIIIEDGEVVGGE